MARKFIDCRDALTKSKCTLTFSADNEEELEEAVAQHAKTVHGALDTDEFRHEIRRLIKEGPTPA